MTPMLKVLGRAFPDEAQLRGGSRDIPFEHDCATILARTPAGRRTYNRLVISKINGVQTPYSARNLSLADAGTLIVSIGCRVPVSAASCSCGWIGDPTCPGAQAKPWCLVIHTSF
jgi:hypothetical protein